MPPFISQLHFQVECCQPLEAFYCGLLGMSLSHHDDTVSFHFPGGRSALSFRPGARAPYQYSRTDFYWKIGITVPALDRAVEHLRAHGCPVGEPEQFGDIGYLAHLKDPAGFNIELLQQGFIGEERPIIGHHPLAPNATLAHLTLRVHDIDTARSHFVDKLGMRLISIQPVTEHGFCLYFFTWHPDATPVADLEAVANREWLWRRP